MLDSTDTERNTVRLIFPMKPNFSVIINEVYSYQKPVFTRLLFQLFIDIMFIEEYRKAGSLLAKRIVDLCFNDDILGREVKKLIKEEKLTDYVDLTYEEIADTCEELYLAFFKEYGRSFQIRFDRCPTLSCIVIRRHDITFEVLA